MRAAALTALRFALPLGMLAAPLAAQPRVALGVRAGLSAAWTRTTTSTSPGSDLSEPVLGPNVGLSAELPVTGPVGAVGEVAYYRKGYDGGNAIFGDDGGDFYPYSVRTHQLSLFAGPTLALTQRSFALAGPRLDLHLGSFIHTDAPGVNGDAVPSNRLVLGYTAGVGAAVGHVRGHVVLVEVRYNGDATSARTYAYSVSDVEHRIVTRNHTLDLRLGVRF